MKIESFPKDKLKFVKQGQKKFDFSVNCEKCRKKVITRAMPGSLVSKR